MTADGRRNTQPGSPRRTASRRLVREMKGFVTLRAHEGVELSGAGR